MNDSNVEDLWIVSKSGELIFHYSNVLHENSEKLLENFFLGVQQFLEDLGGTQFYHLDIKDSLIICINLKQSPINPLYIIGKFKCTNKKRNSKCHNQLVKIIKNIHKFGWDANQSDEVLIRVMKKTIQKMKL